jgi:hypothetical protein
MPVFIAKWNTLSNAGCEYEQPSIREEDSEEEALYVLAAPDYDAVFPGPEFGERELKAVKDGLEAEIADGYMEDEEEPVISWRDGGWRELGTRGLQLVLEAVDEGGDVLGVATVHRVDTFN